MESPMGVTYPPFPFLIKLNYDCRDRILGKGMQYISPGTSSLALSTCYSVGWFMIAAKTGINPKFLFFSG
jgi:hypothetical protein